MSRGSPGQCPPAKVLLAVTHSLFKGYTPGTDEPYCLWSMLAQRSNPARGWTQAEGRLITVGDLYTTSAILGSTTPCHVYPDDTLANAISQFSTMAAACRLTPTDVLLCHGENDLAGSGAAGTVALAVSFWALVRAQWPNAKKWQHIPYLTAGSGAVRLEYQTRVAAGECGSDVSLIDWSTMPSAILSGDPTGVHQNIPSSPSSWHTWVKAGQDYQNDISWCARRCLEAIYGTHNGGAPATLRSLTNLSGETYP